MSPCPSLNRLVYDMQEKDAQRLLEKFRAGQCTEEEKIRLRNWFHTLNLEQPADLTSAELENIGADMWATLQAQTNPKPIHRLWPRLAAAASILILLSAGIYYFNNKPTQQQNTQVKKDLKPGINGAILTLANWQKIILEKTSLSMLIRFWPSCKPMGD